MVFEGLAARSIRFVYALFIRFERGGAFFDFGNYDAALWVPSSFCSLMHASECYSGQLEQELAALMWPVLGVRLRHRLIANGRAFRCQVPLR